MCVSITSACLCILYPRLCVCVDLRMSTTPLLCTCASYVRVYGSPLYNVAPRLRACELCVRAGFTFPESLPFLLMRLSLPRPHPVPDPNRLKRPLHYIPKIIQFSARIKPTARNPNIITRRRNKQIPTPTMKRRV